MADIKPFAFLSAAESEAEHQRLMSVGLTADEATIVQALRGGSQVSAVVLSSDGGGRYPRYLARLRAKGLKVPF